MKSTCIGPTEVPGGATGIWSITTEGDPEYGYEYDTYIGFVVEARSYAQIIKWLKRKVNSDSSYEWTVKLKGVSHCNTSRLNCILASYNAG